MTSVTRRPPILALVKSGYWVAEWLPQMHMLVTFDWWTEAFLASWLLARFSSRRVMAKKRSFGTPSALAMAMRQFVLQGLPTTSVRTSLAAFLAIALPCPVKILPLMPSRSPRSIPALRGTDPTSSAQLVPLKPSLRSEVPTISLRRGKAQSSSSIITPSSAAMPGSISMRRRLTGWSGPNTPPEAMRKRRA